MKALSIRQPYAWLICQGFKSIENRRWSPSYRGPLLIHAPKTIDTKALERFPYAPAEYPTGGIVGRATLVDVLTESQSPWFEGPYGWVLQDARPLPFVAYRGTLGLFDVDGHLLQGESHAS